MNKNYTVSTAKAAWQIVNEIFPTDYNEDTQSSERAGYKVYRSNISHYDYICDLGNRLEVNFSTGETVNIWIDEEEKAESAQMQKNVLTIGLYDKDTEKQEISTPEAKILIANTLIEKFGIFAFTMMECSGVYKMVSTGRIVFEPSIRVEIASDDEIPADAIIGELKGILNQESIMHEVSEANIYFK